MPENKPNEGPDNRATETIELSARRLVSDFGTSSTGTWGDFDPFPSQALSAFAPAAVGFCALGLLASVFAFWWPVLVIAPLAFGPGLSFAYLSFYDARKHNRAGGKPAIIAWVMGYSAAFVWHLFLFEALRPALDLSWHIAGFDLDTIWLLILLAIGLLHGLCLRTQSGAKIAVIVLLHLVALTITAVLLAESHRRANATVHEKRAGSLALGIQHWLNTNQDLRSSIQTGGLQHELPANAHGPADHNDGALSQGNAAWSAVWTIIGLTLAGGGSLAFLSWLSRQGPRELFRDATMVDCGAHRNCISSRATEREKQIDPISFSCSLEEACQRLVLAVSSQPGCKIEYQQPGYLYATFRSRVFRFIDDTEFRIDPQDCVIHCRSASRVGRSDFGANRRRIEAIRKDFVAKYMMLERS